MRNALLVIGVLCLLGTAVAGVLGFHLYPAKRKGKKKREPSQEEGLARALCIILAAGAFVALFLALSMSV